MFYCIKSNNHIVDIENYCIESKLNGVYSPVFCPFCGKILIVKAINSNEKTHFTHKPKQSCSYKSYSEFFKSSGTPKISADIENLIDLYYLDNDIPFSYSFLIDITDLKIFDIFSLTSEKSEIILKKLLYIVK